jgi:hypothetical protein
MTMNILTDKCWEVDVKGWQDNQGRGYSGYVVAQRLECTGFEVIAILSSNEDEDCKLDIRSKRPKGPSVEHLLECAAEAVARAKRKHETS